MAKYIIIDLPFVLFSLGIYFASMKFIKNKQYHIISALILLCILTFIFDNLIIDLGVVAYHADNISRLYIGIAPIEDFAYPIAAIMLLPVIYDYSKKRRHD